MATSLSVSEIIMGRIFRRRQPNLVSLCCVVERRPQLWFPFRTRLPSFEAQVKFGHDGPFHGGVEEFDTDWEFNMVTLNVVILFHRRKLDYIS